ncbi:MAG TPA: ribonuclease III domain-containing protein [Oligoflexia bacterium]|nr:ribonuclease III domain-containing protein [Oligoflexia bacterium]HMP47500.1 ribonuclease III domain-containing protein [Oligoflexia bacterium]
MSVSRDRFYQGMRALESRLHYSFRDVSLLEESLHHHSVGLLDSDRLSRKNRLQFERNEKLGDGALKVVVQSILFSKYPGISAGELTVRESIITCNDNLAHLALRLQIPRFFNETGLLEYRKKTLADTVESILYAIALDAGSGDHLYGLPELRRVCERLFTIEIATSQISHPYVTLLRAVKARGERIDISYKTTFYRGVIAGFVAKLGFRRKLRQQLGVSSFCGTGFSAESAREKAAALVLLALGGSGYISDIKTLQGFSWKIPPG